MSDVENKILRTLSGVLSNNVALEKIDMLGSEAASLQLNHAAGVVGNFNLQASNDEISWYDITSSTLAADNAGLFWNLSNLSSRYMRVKFVGADAGSAYTLKIITKDL